MLAHGDAEPPHAPGRETLAAVLAYLVLSGVSLWPLAIAPATMRPDLMADLQFALADYYLIMWGMAWVRGDAVIRVLDPPRCKKGAGKQGHRPSFEDL